MDVIDEQLTTNLLTKSYEPAIRAALGLAKKTLNQYYNATDFSEVYRITMGELVTTLRLSPSQTSGLACLCHHSHFYTLRLLPMLVSLPPVSVNLGYYLTTLSAVLHPRHKLAYFKNAGWEQAWINTALEIVRAEFDQSYALDDNHDRDEIVEQPAGRAKKVCVFFQDTIRLI
jgi:hypothetical protein